jgi:hypothetical protein
MLTFSALSATSLRISGGSAPVTVFPDAAPKDVKEKDGIVLLPVPEEQLHTQIVSWPGEYNIAGISIIGVGHNEGRQASYVATIDKVRVGCLSLPLCEWTDAQMEAVGDMDVLVMTAGETKLCQKLIDQFDPRVLIILPGKDKAALGALEKVIGAKQTMSEFKLKGSLPAEGREVVVLA